MSDKVTFLISGKAMDLIEGSSMYQQDSETDSAANREAHRALHDSIPRRVGKGWTNIVTTTLEGAEEIRWYCATVGSTFTMEPDPEMRAEGRALLKVAERVREELAKHGWTFRRDEMVAPL